MGSITSHPAIPAAAQTVYVPVYTPAPAPITTATAVPAATANTPVPVPASDPSAAAGVKNSNLLERSRGVLSTVLTGFRGLLTDTNNTAPQRKTLLGE